MSSRLYRLQLQWLWNQLLATIGDAASHTICVLFWVKKIMSTNEQRKSRSEHIITVRIRAVMTNCQLNLVLQPHVVVVGVLYCVSTEAPSTRRRPSVCLSVSQLYE